MKHRVVINGNAPCCSMCILLPCRCTCDRELLDRPPSVYERCRTVIRNGDEESRSFHIMEWIGSWFSAPQSSSLQVAGEISREQIMEFFQKGKGDMFSNPDFKEHLRQGHEKGRSTQDIVNKSQMALWETMGIKGSYGITYLGKIRTHYANDAEMLGAFYE